MEAKKKKKSLQVITNDLSPTLPSILTYASYCQVNLRDSASVTLRLFCNGTTSYVRRKLENIEEGGRVRGGPWCLQNKLLTSFV